jgi:type IV pilus assembly protein PilB
LEDQKLDNHLLQQLENRAIPLGEILKEKEFVTVDQLEEALMKSQEEDSPLGVALLELGYINQAQLRIALQDQAAIKRVQKRRTGVRRRLGEILQAAGLLTEEQLAGALEFSVAHGVKIGEALVQLGIVTEDELAQAVGEQLMIPYIKLSKTPPDPLVLEIIPAKLALRHMVLPVKMEENNLFLAMVDPQNILVIDDIEKSTGHHLAPMIVSEKDFKNCFEAHYGEGAQADNLIEMIEDDDDKSLEDLSDEDFDENSAPIRSLMNKVVTQAVELGTSDIHIEPFENLLLMRYRIDGMLRKGAGPFPPTAALPIASRIKVMAGLDISEIRMPQDGKFRMSLKGKIVDVRVSTCPTSWGEKIVMRILDQSGSRLRLNSLGLEPENLNEFQTGLGAPNGIILVTGPTGSGKTTTLYSALVSLNKPSVNIQTAEDPVEYDLPGIAQTQCLTEIGMTFSKVLKAFLRQDPDIILIGEIRDTETAEIALKAALTGHVVLSTLHTNSSVESIGRLLNMGIDRFLITSAVRVILAQRLMRRLCEKCKEPDLISQRELRSVGINERLLTFESGQKHSIDKLKIFRSVGCDDCLDNGYKGRVAIHEVLPMNEAIAVAITQELAVPELKKIAREQGMMSLRDCALIKSLQGVSALEEVDRLTVNEEKIASFEGDDELIDEIMIRSGSWKLGTKDLVVRKRQGKYIPGAKGKLDPFFIRDDVPGLEKELQEMELGELSSGGGGGGTSLDPTLLKNLLSDVQKITGTLSSGAETNLPVQGLLKNLADKVAGVKKSSPEKIQSKLEHLFSNLEHSTRHLKLIQEPLDLQLKTIPLVKAVQKDIYQKIPVLAAKISTRLGKKIPVKKIKFSKDLTAVNIYCDLDWNLVREALVAILENHLEELLSGGELKIWAKEIPQDGTRGPCLEILMRDRCTGFQQSFGDEVISAGRSTRGRMGLGLAVASRVAKEHGGSLHIQGIAGKGCQTRLVIPIKKKA